MSTRRVVGIMGITLLVIAGAAALCQLSAVGGETETPEPTGTRSHRASTRVYYVWPEQTRANRFEGHVIPTGYSYAMPTGVPVVATPTPMVVYVPAQPSEVYPTQLHLRPTVIGTRTTIPTWTPQPTWRFPDTLTPTPTDCNCQIITNTPTP